MSLTTTSIPTATPPPAAASFGDSAENRRDVGERELFSSVIARASRAPGSSKEADARTAAQGLVSTALVQPIFKQLRESASAAAPPFGPGPGERSFRSMLDTTMAQKLVSSQNWPLVDRLARDLLKKGSPTLSLTSTPLQIQPLPTLTASDVAR